ncbi:MAG: carbohydrate ABC transporter permease [Limnochordaceae bacterium]|nr:carbohydrate ABC transporter permease [Limnochordaceae bacterium]
MAVVFLAPVALMIVTAFKSTQEIFMNPFGLPASWSLEPFVQVWTRASFSVYFRNSVWVTVASLVVVLASSSMAAYALARLPFRGSTWIYMFFLAGIMVPIRLGILPLFLLMRNLGLLNTHWSLILTYAASGMPMSVFLLTGFFRSLPGEVREAARMDGCTEFQTFWKVMLPLVRPALATVAIVNFVPWWNDMFFPLLFIQKDALKTIPLGMTIFFGQYQTDWGLLFAGMVMASVPLVAMYLAMSRHFIAGLTAGAVKG